MELQQLARIKNLMESKKVTYAQLAEASGMSVITLKRLLGNTEYNPTFETIKKIALALGVPYLEILEGKEFNAKEFLGVKGYIDYRGKITRINSLNDLRKITEQINTEVNAKSIEGEYEKQDKNNQQTQIKEPIDISSIDLSKEEEYDTKQLYTWSFRKSDDEKDIEELDVKGKKGKAEPFTNDLGNMCKGYPFKVCGEEFQNSECAYIAGLFSLNTPKSIKIQKELQECDNGYEAKKAIRRKYEQVGGLHREDWNTFNVQWMLYVVWQKVSQNKVFSKKLMVIPDNAMIVENSTYQKGETALFWGMKNEELRKAHDIIDIAVEIEQYDAKKKDVNVSKRKKRSALNHIGVWEGVNCMGKILTICKHCLEKGIEPPIDYDLLRSKQIYLFGKLLTFEDAPKAADKATQVPVEAPKRKVEEKPTEEKKTSQEGSKQVDSSENRVKGIIGAVIGDVVGSRFEFYRMKGDKIPTRYKLFASSSSLTDDTVLTMAVADALMHKKEFRDTFWTWAKRYPHAGFGRSFKTWLRGGKDLSNDSKGNGCGMRVSPVGFYANSLEETLELARQSAIISHNSEEGIRGAQSIAAATYMAKEHRPKDEIKSYIENTFGYNLDQTDEEIETKVAGLTQRGERELAENTCPLAIIAFLVTDDYESAIKKAISYSCDTDTVACMAGGIASAYYGVPQAIIDEAQEYLPQEFIDVINEFDGINLHNTRTTPKDCHRWGDIIVYGSGENKNGETEAFTASKYFGASKVLEGMEKRAYAIPTVGRSLDEIKAGVDRFIEYADANPDKTFLVTRVGCSKAGYSPKDIAPMFKRVANLPNIYLPVEFREALNSSKS